MSGHGQLINFSVRSV